MYTNWLQRKNKPNLRERFDLADGGRLPFKENPQKNFFMGGEDASKKGAEISAAKRKINVTTVSDSLAKKIKQTKLKGMGVVLETTSGGGKVIRVRVTNSALDKFKIDSLPATEENLKKIKNHLENVKNTDVYKDNITPPKGDKEKLKSKKTSYYVMKATDPEWVYKEIQKLKTKMLPGDSSSQKVIHHMADKTELQTLNKLALIDKEINNLDSIKKAEDTIVRLKKIRNWALARPSTTFNNRILEAINARLKRIVKNDLVKTEAKGLKFVDIVTRAEDGTVTTRTIGGDTSLSIGKNTKLGDIDFKELKRGNLSRTQVINLAINELKALEQKDILKIAKSLDCPIKKADGGRITYASSVDMIGCISNKLTKNPETFVQKITNRTGSVLAKSALGTLKLIDKALSPLLTPIATVALHGGQEVDLSNPINYLSPIFWKGAIERYGATGALSMFTKVPGWQNKLKILGDVAIRAGMPVKMINLISRASPYLLAGMTAYQLKNWADKNLEFKPLTEDQQIDIDKRKKSVSNILDTYEQASEIAKDQNISYEEALKLVDKPEVPGINFNEELISEKLIK